MSVIYHNVWTKDPYIYKSTTSGINIYDLETTSLFNFIEHTNTGCVWVNDDYMYVSTTVSGIYRCETSTVTGTVNLEPYKQYQDITSNYVYYIHGGGDYLCATTESGVDHYNFTTGSGIYTTLSDVGKCFQTARGEFYYTYKPTESYSELHVVYDVTNNWGIETVGYVYTIEDLCLYDPDKSWLSDYSKRIKLTIDNTNVDSTLLDFPVLIKLSDSSGISSTDVSAVFTELGSDANRKKIAVTTSDEETQCYVEIERFDYVNSVAWLWVKVPYVASGDTTILYLYYDANQADNISYVGDTTDTITNNVWDSNFVVVYHMAQDPNGDTIDAIKDSTSNANHGTPGGSMTTADLVDGKTGKSIEFDGIDDYMDTKFSIVLADPLLEATFEFIAVSDNVLMSTDRYSGLTGDGRIYTNTSGQICYYMDNQNSTPYVEIITSTEGSIKTEFNYYAVVTNISNNNYLLVVNSSIEQVYKNFLTGEFPYDDVFISRSHNYTWSDSYYYSNISDIRVSNVPRSAAWIKATYYSNWDELISFGSEEDYSTNFVKINDLYVTEKTSRYYEGNVIFLATTNGVIVIEEKPGDEENSNFKYYLINT